MLVSVLLKVMMHYSDNTNRFNPVSAMQISNYVYWDY